MKSVFKDGYEFKKSTNKKKKYDALKNNKKIASFGGCKSNGEPYQQFKDKIGLYKDYDHNDKERLRRYKARHNKPIIKDTPNYFSHKYLW